MQRPSVEQHHADVDATLSGLHHALTQSHEVRRVESIEIELRLAVLRGTGARARPRLGRHVEMESATRRLRTELLPAPEPDEVVPTFLEKPQIRAIAVLLGLSRCLRPGPKSVVKVVPDVRSGEIHGASLLTAVADDEVTRVATGDGERAERGARDGRRGHDLGSRVRVAH